MHPKMKSLIAVSAAALTALLAVTGCSSNNPPADQTTTTVSTTPPPPPPPAPATTTTTTTATTATTSGAPAPANAPGTNNTNAGPGGATGTSSATADAVNKAIHTNVQLTGSRITAVVDAAGVATLTGTAQNQQQKGLAERAASNTPGVTSVKNKVEIVPTGGAKAAAVKTKVIQKTVIVHDQAPASNGANGTGTGASDNGAAGANPNGTTDNSGSTSSTTGQ